MSEDCDCECEERGGNCCSQCQSPNSTTTIVEEDGDEVDTNAEVETESDCECDCEERGGNCCSQCQSPDSITTAEEGDPWEMGFDNLIILHGSGGAGSNAPIVLTFMVYPGHDLLPRIMQFLPQQDWPADSWDMFDEDWNPITSGDEVTIDEEGELWKIIIDLQNYIEGLYSAFLKNNDIQKGVEIEIDGDPEPYIEITPPAEVLRGYPSTVHLTARNSDGSIDTDYSGGSLDMISNTLDYLGPTIVTIPWVNGEADVIITPTGGSGNEGATWYAIDNQTNLTGVVAVTVMKPAVMSAVGTLLWSISPLGTTTSDTAVIDNIEVDSLLHWEVEVVDLSAGLIGRVTALPLTGWLLDTDPAQNITVTVNTAGLANGTHTGTLRCTNISTGVVIDLPINVYKCAALAGIFGGSCALGAGNMHSIAPPPGWLYWYDSAFGVPPSPLGVFGQAAADGNWYLNAIGPNATIHYVDGAGVIHASAIAPPPIGAYTIGDPV